MSFAKLSSDRVPEHVEETWVLESSWSASTPGREYYAVHLRTIRDHETAPPIFERYLPQEPIRILESGCGTGRWLAYFEALGHVVYGVDHSQPQLQFAKAHAPEFHLSAGDVLATPFQDNSFDAVFSSYVAEHFEDGPLRVLRECRRVLRPGGLLFLVVPYANPWRRWVVHPLFRVLYRLWRFYAGLRFTEYHFRRDELDRVLFDAGFEILDCAPDDYYAPWSKGLYCDVSDILGFVNYPVKRPFQFGRVGTAIVRMLHRWVPLWWYCEGIFYVARSRKESGQS